MVEWTTGYKALSVVKGQLYSWCAYRQFTRLYSKDRVNGRPAKGGPLVLFESLETAERFANQFGRSKWEIWEVRYVPAKSTGKHTDCLWYTTKDGWTSFCALDNLPIGTVLANKLKLVQCVAAGGGEEYR